MPRQCPTCESEMSSIVDYPYVKILDVSSVQPDDIPDAVPNWNTEELMDRKRSGWNRPMVPRKVIEHFERNPYEIDLVHEDGYVYTAPDIRGATRYEELKLFGFTIWRIPSAQSGFWYRSINLSDEIKKLLGEEGSARKYLDSLERRVGTTVRREEISLGKTQNEGGILYPLIYLCFHEESDGVAEVCFSTRGPIGNDYKLITAGKIKYEGVLNDAKP